MMMKAAGPGPAAVATLGLLAILMSASAGASEIYRTVDADGNVVFTDIPPREDDQNAEQIVIENPNSFAVDEAIPSSDAWIVEPDDDSEGEAPFSYNTLSIVSPTDDEAVRENAGNLTIVTNVSPRLQRGHVIRLLMDGSVAQEGPQGTFNLANVDRGSHSLALEILDDRGQVLMRSDATTFHMLRYRIP